MTTKTRKSSPKVGLARLSAILSAAKVDASARAKVAQACAAYAKTEAALADPLGGLSATEVWDHASNAQAAQAVSKAFGA